MKRFCLPKIAFSLMMLCFATAIASPAQTFETLVNFDRTDGAIPDLMSLVQAADGNFYGTTMNGGANNHGTVFNVTPEGKLTTLYSFCSLANCSDGALPAAGLVQATDRNFYGTTPLGGAYGYGTVFRMTPDGTLTTLHSFNGTDGLNPESTLVQATDGNFYGTTSAFFSNPYGIVRGTVFKITPEGKLTTLHRFCSAASCSDGALAVDGLVEATDGDFYGTTALGGAYDYGTVFRITPDGMLTTLHSFDGADGGGPYATLVQATDGDFYGITVEGGAHYVGTVFKITAQGKLTTLHNFCSLPSCTDGVFPEGGLMQATDGNFYGTTYEGGDENGNSYCCGTVFKITPEGKLTTLHSFCSLPPLPNCSDGLQPVGGLLQATNGDFYGTTSVGGADDDGTVFSLSMGLGSFVKTQPNSSKVGTKVIVLGNNLTEATSVTFNGTEARFNVVSDTEIKTSVPRGATTGTVEVTTPSGTLKSNLAFRVTN